MPGRTALIPYFGYRDAKAAMRFLEQAFGFRSTVVFDDADGRIVHGEMELGGQYIMLGTGTDEQRAPERENKPAGRGVYCTVDDVDAHFERSQRAGATIVYPPEQTEFGTRRYRALDPEGYEWSFGTYRPGDSAGD